MLMMVKLVMDGDYFDDGDGVDCGGGDDGGDVDL